MAKNQTKTKSRTKKKPTIAPVYAGKPRTYVSIGSDVVIAGSPQDEHGCFWGDAAVVQNLPAADRAELARHLVAVAGNLLSTVGDPIAGATIVVLTRRADG